MKRMALVHLAHARSGDKGNTANVGVIAYDAESWDVVRREVTAERVRAHLPGLVLGRVERFELPKVQALNFLLHDALGGGGTLSLRTDNQGKVLSTAVLRMLVDVPDDLAERVRAKGRVPPGWKP